MERVWLVEHNPLFGGCLATLLEWQTGLSASRLRQGATGCSCFGLLTQPKPTATRSISSLGCRSSSWRGSKRSVVGLLISGELGGRHGVLRTIKDKREKICGPAKPLLSRVGDRQPVRQTLLVPQRLRVRLVVDLPLHRFLTSWTRYNYTNSTVADITKTGPYPRSSVL
jgi:hypothetical protein